MGLMIAQALLCTESEHDLGCGQCKSCHQVDDLIHPDLHIAFPVVRKEGVERKNTTSKDFMPLWRDMILENPYLSYNDWIRAISKTSANGDINVKECNDIIRQLSLQAFAGTRKVQVIWIADEIGTNGNKLLKLVEEPPPGTFLIFICLNTEKMLGTLISRCQVIRLSPIDDASIVKVLMEKYQVAHDLAHQSALLSDGDFSQALTYAQLEEDTLLDHVLQWIQLCRIRDYHGIRNWSVAFGQMNTEEQKTLLSYFLKVLESIIYGLLLGDQAIRMNELDKKKLKSCVSNLHLSVVEIEILNDLIADMTSKIERYVPGRMVMFDGSLSLSRILSGKIHHPG